MPLHIMGVDSVNRLLSQPHDFTAIISISDPDRFPDVRPIGITSIPNRLELQFDDVEILTEFTKDCVFPTRTNAQSIVDFLNQFNDEQLLVHCAYGKSRSTAVGLYWCAKRYGIAQAKLELLRLAPRATPNVLLAQFLDEIGGFGGALHALALDFDYQAIKQLAQRGL